MQLETVVSAGDHDNLTALPIGVVLALAAGVVLVALLGRRRMPAGLGEGVFVAGLSGGGLLLFAADSAGNLTQPALGHVLAALAVLWYALSLIDARRQPSGMGQRASSDEDEAVCGRSRLLAYAALVCGLAALVSSLSAPGGLPAPGWSAATTDFVALLLLSALVWAFGTGAWAAYPLAALLVCLFASVIPSNGLKVHETAVGIVMNGLGLLSLIVVIGTLLARWWRRRRVWLQDPQRLTELPPPSKTLFVLLVGAGSLVGVGGMLLREAAFTPTAVLLAALTCLTIGHLRAWTTASEIGLILVAEGIVTASMAWLSPGWPGALFGLGLAAIYLLWLARFWDQQLNKGVSWTTAGRLIPIARRLAYAASLGAFAVALGGFRASGLQAQPVWIALVTTVVLLGTVSLLVRDAYEQRRADAAFAACLMVLAATGPGCRLLSEPGASPVSPVVVIAAGALLLVMRVAVSPRTPSTAAIYIAYVGGVLPVIVLFALTLRGFDAQLNAALGLTAAAVLVGLKAFRATPWIARAEQPRGA